ncbi:MAG: ABC transporter ATP-binding protein [Pseudomonadota bacterium]
MSSQNQAEQDTQYAVEMRNVVHNYHKQDQSSVFVFSDWQLNIAEQVFLYGNSGSGKSTILNLLSGILQPESGSISLFGTDIVTLSHRARDRFRANNIGVVFQQFNLIEYLSVAQNIKLAAHFKTNKERTGAITTSEVKSESVQELLEQLKLDKSVMHRKVSELSVGQRQRVAILRAFANSPSLLLVDEPTSALDASARDAFMDMLLNTSESHATAIVFVSHDEALKGHFARHLAMNSLLSQDASGATQRDNNYAG